MQRARRLLHACFLASGGRPGNSPARFPGRRSPLDRSRLSLRPPRSVLTGAAPV